MHAWFLGTYCIGAPNKIYQGKQGKVIQNKLCVTEVSKISKWRENSELKRHVRHFLSFVTYPVRSVPLFSATTKRVFFLPFFGRHKVVVSVGSICCSAAVVFSIIFLPLLISLSSSSLVCDKRNDYDEWRSLLALLFSPPPLFRPGLKLTERGER